MEELENAAGYDLAREGASDQIVLEKNEELASGVDRTEQDEGSEPITEADDIDYSELPKEVRDCFPDLSSNYEYNLYSSLSLSAYP